MNISFTFKNFEPSEHLKQYARKRLKKLGKFILNSDGVDVSVLLVVDKHRQRAEVRITGDQIDVAAAEQSDDMYSTIDLVMDKLSAQLKKQQEKKKEHRRRSRQAPVVQLDTLQFEDGDEGKRKIVTSDRFAPKPLSVEEAYNQLDTGSSKETFIVFINALTNRVNILHRLANGDFGLIDPDA